MLSQQTSYMGKENLNRLITKVSNKILLKRKEKPFFGAFGYRVALVHSAFKADVKTLLSFWLPKYI